MTNFRLWRNKTKSLISNSKRKLYVQNINENKRNPKNLHDLTNKPKRHTTPSLSNHEGEPTLSPEESANIFNDYFTSAFQQFHTDDSGTFCISDKLENFVKGKLAPKFNIPPVSLVFVQKQLP